MYGVFLKYRKYYHIGLSASPYRLFYPTHASNNVPYRVMAWRNNNKQVYSQVRSYEPGCDVSLSSLNIK